MKPPPCVVDRWAGGSFPRGPKGSFAVSWPRQLGHYIRMNIIAIVFIRNLNLLVVTGYEAMGPEQGGSSVRATACHMEEAKIFWKHEVG